MIPCPSPTLSGGRRWPVSDSKITIHTRPIAVRPRTAARMIDIKKTKMQQLIDSGQVQTSQPGGPNTAIFVLVESLENYLRKGMANVA